MVMVPDAGKMHFRHSDQQNSSRGGPRPPHGLRNFGARRVVLHTTWYAPQAKNPSNAPVRPILHIILSGSNAVKHANDINAGLAYIVFGCFKTSTLI